MALETRKAKLDTLAHQVFGRMKADHVLPSPSELACEVARLIGTKNTPRQSVLKALESDPPTAERILKLVNAPVSGVSPQLGSLADALEYLGMRPLKSLVLAMSLVTGQKRVPCPGFAYDVFWSEAVARATAARHIAHQANGVPPYEAFAVGLLSRVGSLALATAYHVAYGHILREVPVDNIGELVKRERAMFEIDHIDLTAEMMDDWGLPSDCSNAIRRQNGLVTEGVELSAITARLAENLHLASSIAFVLIRPEAKLEGLNRIVNEAAQLGIPPGDFHAMFDSISREWRDLAAVFAVSRRRVPPLATLYSQAYLRQHPTP